MCVIIDKQAGVTLPFEKLKSACTVNPAGFGMVIVDRGKIELRRSFEAKGNDPEKIQKLLHEFEFNRVVAHLRYRTKGETSAVNVHPFTVLKDKHHGMDVQFMHNGTMSDFGTDKHCDSKHFAESFLRPLLQRFRGAIDDDKLLLDPILHTILEKYAGSGIFTLVDNYGNVHTVNKTDGEQYEGWWASNAYSFNRTHRDVLPAKTTYRGYGKGYSAWDNDWNDSNWPDWEMEKGVRVYSQTAPAKAINGSSQLPPSNTTGDIIDVESTGETKLLSAPEKRMTFLDVANISDLGEVCALSQQQIADIVEHHPAEAVMLIQDLLLELYDMQDDSDEETTEATPIEFYNNARAYG